MIYVVNISFSGVDDVLFTFSFKPEAVLTINEIRIAETSARTFAPSQKRFLAVSSGKERIRKIVPRGNTGGDIGTIAGPWEGRRGLEERLAAKSPTLELKVVGMSEP